MELSKIVAEHLNLIGKRATKIIDVNFAPVYLSLGGLPPKFNSIVYDEPKAGETFTIDIRSFSTKRYRDVGCAIFKTLKSIEELLPRKMEILVWRCYPTLDNAVSWRTGITWYRGYFRVGWRVG